MMTEPGVMKKMKQAEIYVEPRTGGFYWFLVSEYDKVIAQGVSRTNKMALKSAQGALYEYLELMTV